MGAKISAKGVTIMLVIAIAGLLMGLRLYTAGLGMEDARHQVPGQASSQVEGQVGEEPAGPAHETGTQFVEITSVPYDFFAESRLERERARSKQVELLQGIANSKNSTPKERADAEARMLDLMERMEKETRVETLIESKGFARALVFLGDNSCDVIVETDGLTPLGAQQIGDIVARICGLSIEKVTITEHKS